MSQMLTHKDATLVLVDEGQPKTYRSNRGRLRTVTVGRVWDVHLGDTLIGQVRYDMRTRETKAAGRTYVNNRWSSPGWTYHTPGGYRGIEGFSRKDCVEGLIWTHEKSTA